MNSDVLVQLVQKGFRITLGATSALIETVQDPTKREQTLTQLRSNWSELSAEWAEKGELTEQEARKFVETVLTQAGRTAATSSPTPATASTATPTVQADLEELIGQIAALRTEVERLRSQDSNS